jgi:DNA primase
LEVCLTGKVDIRLAFVPEGKDPCDYVIEAGPEAFEAVIESAEDVLSFKWKHLADELAGQDSLSQRTEAVQQFLKTVALAVQAGRVDSLSLAMLIGRLSGLLQTPKSLIDEELHKLLKQKPAAERTQGRTEDAAESRKTPQNAILRVRREILEVLLHEPALYASAVGRLTRDDFGPEGPLREIADILLDSLEAGDEPELVLLYGRIEAPETASLLTEIASAGGVKGAGPRRLEDSLGVLEQHRRRQDIDAHKGRLTDEATDALRQIDGRLKQQKGNLRCGGLQ